MANTTTNQDLATKLEQKIQVAAATNQEREMRVAVERVVGFAQEFGETHLNLACHAAFPLSLTPDLLYQIWANFVPEAPWTAVARVLLSQLCKQVGSELYEMDNSVRNLLLRDLKEQFGQERFDSLGEFLLEYVSQRLTEDDPDTKDLRQAQEWTALAYTKPEQAARELAQVLSDRVQQEDIGEVLRLSSLVKTLSEPLVEANYNMLLVYAFGVESFAKGNLDEAADQLEIVCSQGLELKAAGVKLNIPRYLLTAISKKRSSIDINQQEGILLSPFQRKLLRKNLEKDLRPEYIRRIEIMLMADLGYSQTEICQALNCSHETARYWLFAAKTGQAHKWRELSIGRPKTINEEYLARLKELVSQSPRDCGYAFTRWTAQWLSKHLAKEFGIEISDRHINRLLKKMGLSTRYKRSQTENSEEPMYNLHSKANDTDDNNHTPIKQETETLLDN